MLPGSTWRRPTRPVIGAVIRACVSCSFALSIPPWSASTAASYWRTSDSWVSTCWRGDRILREQRAIALEIGPRVLEQRLVARELPGGERELHLERPRVDLGEEVARLHHLALLEGNAHELAVHAAADHDGVERRHRAERVQVDVEAARRTGATTTGIGAQRGIDLTVAIRVGAAPGSVVFAESVVAGAAVPDRATHRAPGRARRSSRRRAASATGAPTLPQVAPGSGTAGRGSGSTVQSWQGRSRALVATRRIADPKRSVVHYIGDSGACGKVRAARTRSSARAEVEFCAAVSDTKQFFSRAAPIKPRMQSADANRRTRSRIPPDSEVDQG